MRPVSRQVPIGPCLVALAVAGGALAVAGGAPAATLTVQPDGGGAYPTIQAAVQAAQPGDTIELADGIFAGDGNRDVDLLGKAITIRSQSGDAASCVIDAEGNVEDTHRCFILASGEGPATVLRDLTITGAMVNGC